MIGDGTWPALSPDGKLVVLPNSNHDATVRNPAAFNRELVNFLALH